MRLDSLPPLAVLGFAEGAIAAFVATYVWGLWILRPARVEWAVFGGVAASASTVAVGSALLAASPNADAAETGGTLLLLGVAFLTATGVDLARRLSAGVALRLQEEVPPRAIPAEGRSAMGIGVAGAGAVGIVLLAAGGQLFTGSMASAPTWGFVGAPDLPEPELTAATQLALGCLWLGATAGWIALLAVEPAEVEVRMVRWAFAAGLAAAGHDLFVAVASLRDHYLLGHVVAVGTFASSFVLVGRLARARDALRVRTAQLKESLGELRSTQDELVRAEQLAAVGELSGALAHEVRNPLAAIRNASRLLRRPTDPRPREELLSILDEEIDNLNRLVSDLLEYARPVRLHRRPLAVDELLRRVARDSPHSARIVVVPTAADLAEVNLDEELVERALLELVANAAASMPEGGDVVIQAEHGEEGTVLVRVRDTGHGMPAKVLERACDPFFSTRHQRTGLGLSVVQQVCRAHGGSLLVESLPGEGTRVTMRLTSGAKAPAPISDGASAP